MLSVVIPLGGERSSQEVENEVKRALAGIVGEVIFAESWQEGIKIARGEFISFISPDGIPGPGFYGPLLHVFTSQPSFRKLALVAPFSGNGAPASREPYPVRVAPLGGAVIRKSALEGFGRELTGNLSVDSYNLSVDFWNRGLRCYVHPGACLEGFNPASLTNKDDLIEADPKVLLLWKREMI